MPRFYINEVEIPPPPPDICSFDQFLKHVEDKHLDSKSIIQEINVDGIAVESDEMAEDSCRFSREFGQGQKIAITTTTIGAIAQSSIAEAISYLDRIEAITPSLSISMQSSPGPEDFENLKELYNGFYWLNLLLDRLRVNFSVSLEDIKVQELSANEHQLRFLSVLRQLVDSQERADFILISDLLEYELLPLIPIWKEIFAKMGQSLVAAK
jgi:hypothetical protein